MLFRFWNDWKKSKGRMSWCENYMEFNFQCHKCGCIGTHPPPRPSQTAGGPSTRQQQGRAVVTEPLEPAGPQIAIICPFPGEICWCNPWTRRKKQQAFAFQILYHMLLWTWSFRVHYPLERSQFSGNIAHITAQLVLIVNFGFIYSTIETNFILQGNNK